MPRFKSLLPYLLLIELGLVGQCLWTSPWSFLFFFFFTLVISKADMIMPFAQMFIVRIRGQSKCFAQSWYWKMLRVQVIDAPGALWPEIPIIRLRLGPWLWQCLGRGPSTRHRLLALSVFVQMLGPCACECTTEWWFSWFKSQVWTQRREEKCLEIPRVQCLNTLLPSIYKPPQLHGGAWIKSKHIPHFWIFEDFIFHYFWINKKNICIYVYKIIYKT